MKNSQLINKIMFDYQEMTESEIINKIQKLPNKLLRWLAKNHPDNRTRKLFLKETNIEIGKHTVININFIVSDNYKPKLKIGKRVAISPNVTIICVSEPNNSILKDYDSLYSQKIITQQDVVIEDDVWIGSNVTILPGVTIGARSIIGAGSVVTKNIECDSLAFGVPIKKIKNLLKVST